MLLSLTVNVLAASLALSGFVGYVGVYTVWLKRRTPQNIVIGGAAGAVPPLVGWAATRGSLSWTAVYLFAIVFYWTPPHFWALSLLMKDEYAKVGIPMMPVVRGERETRRQILLYTLLLYAISQLPFCAGAFGADLPRRLDGARRRVHRRIGASVPPSGPPGCAEALSVLTALPCAAVRRDGGRRQAVASDEDAMDRKLARKNIRSGLIAGAACCLHVRNHVPRRRDLRSRVSEIEAARLPPAGEEIHLPGPTLIPLVSAVGITLIVIGTTI